MRNSILFALALALFAGTAQGNLLIDVGQISLLPNQAGQKINFFVYSDGPDSTQGLNFNVQLGDGGPAVGGVDITPAITSLDPIGPGTLFEFNHLPPHFDYFPPSLATTSFPDAGGVVPIPVGPSLLAVVTFDTTGFGPGYSTTLKLADTLNGDTQILYAAGFQTINNGSITIVPEPSTVALAAFGFIGLAAWGWRKRRA